MLDRDAILGAFDAIFQPASLVRELARTVAAERELPEDWLNDGAKGFISPRAVYLLEDLFAAKERRP